MGDQICLGPPVSHIHPVDHLPAVVWAQVCSLSDIRSLKRIRLANSGVTHIAAHYLFEGLCVTLIPRYFDKVTKVAFHPSLRFNVRILYFDYSTLKKRPVEYDEWKIGIDNEDSLYGEETMAEDQVQGMSQADLKRQHANFSQLLASQKAYLDGRMDLATLSAALAMLPNLRAVKSMDQAYGSSGRIRGLQDSAFRILQSMIVCFLIDIDDLEVRLQGSLPTSITTFVAGAQRLRSLRSRHSLLLLLRRI